MLYCTHMAEFDFERFAKVVLEEFKGLNERFDSVDGELRDIRKRLDGLEDAADNASGFAKEIDHLLKRLVAIQKHLGLEANIRA